MILSVDGALLPTLTKVNIEPEILISQIGTSLSSINTLGMVTLPLGEIRRRIGSKWPNSGDFRPSDDERFGP